MGPALRLSTRLAACSLLVLLGACSRAPAGAPDDPDPPGDPAAVTRALEPAPPPAARPRLTPPDALVAADDLSGPFPIPTHARFVRQAGRMSVYRVVARLDQLTRFYRDFDFTVFEKGDDATVRPPRPASKRPDLLLIQHRGARVYHLVVHEGGARE